MASRRRASAPYGRKKRDAVTVGRRIAIGILVLALVVLGVLLVTHGKKTPQHAASSTTTVAAQRAKKLSPAQQRTITAALGKMAAESKVVPRATFKLTYSAFDVPGSPSKISLEEMPPDRLFKALTSEVIVKGKKTYYCTTVRVVSCHVTKSPAASPLGRLMAVYSPATYVATFQTLRAMVRSGAAYHFSSSQRTIAGQLSACISWSYRYSSVNYCITKTGVLTNFTISGLAPSGAISALTFSISLRSYSSQVTTADFALPRGAKVSAAP